MFVFPSSPWSAPKDIPGGSTEDAVVLTESSEQVVYRIYDQLAADFPGYVKKQIMGQVFQKSINRYTFTPENPICHIPVVTAVHGHEQGCAWTAAHFFQLLCRQPDPQLSYLRDNVCFDVIPVANPWGFANNQRKNGNGIDLNRNFQPEFVAGRDPASKEYGGPFPCSETETQAIMQLIEENPQACVVLDYHNIGRGYPLYYTYGGKEEQLAPVVFSALTEKWHKEYPQLQKDPYLGRMKPNGHEGMFADYILTKNLWALTMETPWCMPEVGQNKYDAVTIRTALEVLVNTLLTIVSSL